MTSSNDGIPANPPEMAKQLYKLGGEVTGIRVQYLQTGTETADTKWILELGDKKLEGWKSSFAPFLDFYPNREVRDWRCIAALKPSFAALVVAREKWEKANNHELSEYRRLKAKFEGTADE